MLAPGAVYDRYEIVRHLGAGGMAHVYVVRHQGLGTLHALKVLTVGHPAVRERLLREGRIQGGLHHPNVVQVTDLLDIDGAPGLVMELVAGPDLAALIGATRLRWDQIDALVRPMLDGLAAAHAVELVHRDLKPGNVLVDVVSGRLVPKIADFGLAKVLGGSDTETRSGVTMGTPAYMAPEQIRNARDVDHRADLFSMGVMLYELCTGVRPFAGEDNLELFDHIARADFASPRDLVPDLPERMERAILASLVADRDARVSTCAALAALWADHTSMPHLPWSEGELALAGSLGSVRPDELVRGITPQPVSGRPQNATTPFLDTFRHSVPDTTPLPASEHPSVPQTTPPPAPSPPTRWAPRIAAAGVAGLAALGLVALWPEAGPTQTAWSTLELRDGAWHGVDALDPGAPRPHRWVRVTTDGGHPVEVAWMRGDQVAWEHEALPVITQRWEGDQVVRHELASVGGGLRHAVEVEHADGTVTLRHLDPEGHPAPDPIRGVLVEVHRLDPAGRTAEVHFEGVSAPMAGTSGAWGERVARDEEGRPLAITALGPDRAPSPDARGIVETRFTRDRDRPWLVAAVHHVGFADVAMPDPDGCATVALTWDAAGDERSRRCLDAEGAPAYAAATGCHLLTTDRAGSTVTTRCRGIDDEPVIGREGYAELRAVLGPSGLPESTSTFGVDGEPVDARGGYHVAEHTYDGHGMRLTEGPYTTVAGEAVVGEDGFALRRFRLDPHGARVEEATYGTDGALIIGPDGAAILRRTFDAAGRLTERRTFDPRSEPINALAGTPRVALAYTLGRVSEERHLDPGGRLVNNNDGFARRVTRFDPHHLKATAQDYFDADGEAVLVSGCDCAGVRTTYDERGHLRRIEHLGLDGAGIDGRARIEVVQDARGRTTSQRFFDATGAPVRDDDGHAGTDEAYDARGNNVEIVFIGLDGKPASDISATHCARITSTYDPHNHETSRRCFDALDRPAVFAPHRGGTFHLQEFTYDARGQVLTEHFYDAAGEPTTNLVGYHALDKTWDARGHLVEERSYDTTGALAPNLEGWAVARYVWDPRGVRIASTYTDAEGAPVIAYGCRCARSTTTLDPAGRPLVWRRYGVDGELLPGASVLRMAYDDRGRRSEMRFEDAAGNLTFSEWRGYATQRTRYDARGQATKERYDADGHPLE